MLPNTTAPKIGAALAETVARVNGEEPSPLAPLPQVEGNEVARLQAQVAHYKALANGDGDEFDKLTKRLDEVSRERDELRRKADKPAVTVPELEGTRELVAISKIVRTGGTQTRSALDERTVESYAAAMSAGDVFPVIRLVYDGHQYLLVDGFHRVAAAEKIGKRDLYADVVQGTSRDAIFRSLAANREHDKTGLRRTNADKQKAVKYLLKDPEWSKLSDREIARHVGVHNSTVSEYRKSICRNPTDSTPAQQPAPTVTTPAAPHFPQPQPPPPRTVLVNRGGTQYEQQVGNIGKKATTQYKPDEFSQRAPDDDAPMMDEDGGGLPPFDDTPELPPAQPKQPSPLAPLPQGEGKGTDAPTDGEGNGTPSPVMPIAAPLPPPAPAAFVDQRTTLNAQAQAQALLSAQPMAAIDCDQDNWGREMLLKGALIKVRGMVEMAFGMPTETKRQIYAVIDKAMKDGSE